MLTLPAAAAAAALLHQLHTCCLHNFFVIALEVKGYVNRELTPATDMRFLPTQSHEHLKLLKQAAGAVAAEATEEDGRDMYTLSLPQPKLSIFC
jgi:2-methylcitrate dehydratase PrpD